ncbi:hypothetical protein ACF0H5_015591 [Mactra antiquata]
MLQASKHQGHHSFIGSGRQCVTNSLVAIHQSYSKPISRWVQETMDLILQTGDKLYVQLSSMSGNTYFSIDDIPQTVLSTNISKSFPICGTIFRQDSDDPFFTVYDAFGKAFYNSFKDHESVIFTMGNSLPAYTSAIIKQYDTFYFFDAHSRTVSGMSCADGLATVTKHISIVNLSQFVKSLAISLGYNLQNDVKFEVTQVSMDLDFDSDSNFSGFSSVSEGEISCKMYLVQEFLNRSESDISISDISDIELLGNVSPDISISEQENESCSSWANEIIDCNLNDLDVSVGFIDSIDTNDLHFDIDNYGGGNKKRNDANVNTKQGVYNSVESGVFGGSVIDGSSRGVDSESVMDDMGDTQLMELLLMVWETGYLVEVIMMVW